MVELRNTSICSGVTLCCCANSSRLYPSVLKYDLPVTMQYDMPPNVFDEYQLQASRRGPDTSRMVVVLLQIVLRLRYHQHTEVRKARLSVCFIPYFVMKTDLRFKSVRRRRPFSLLCPRFTLSCQNTYRHNFHWS